MNKTFSRVCTAVSRRAGSAVLPATAMAQVLGDSLEGKRHLLNFFWRFVTLQFVTLEFLFIQIVALSFLPWHRLDLLHLTALKVATICKVSLSWAFDLFSV